MNTHAAVGQISGTTPVPDYFTQHVPSGKGFSPRLSDVQARFLAAGVRAAPRPERVESELQHIADLRKRLEGEPLLESPERVALHGVFYPAVLLTPGLWERSESVGGPPIKWRTRLQEWLFAGFEEWAPSWDLNATNGGDESILLGQIGSDDEAYSLRVEIRGAGARRLRDELIPEGEMVCSVELTGTLAAREHGVPLSPRMQAWPKTFHYCLFVDLDGQDEIKRVERTESYSGYLWECVSPSEWLSGKDVPDLADAFFIWEHTDLASPEAREYGLDALRHKHDYVERRWGKLALIQKSAPVVPGTPQIATEPFMALVSDDAG